MAEQDSGERSEKATPRKEQQAKNKGQVPRSKELTTAFVLIISPLALMMTSGAIAKGFVKVGDISMSVGRNHLFNDQYLMDALAASMWAVFSALIIFFAAVFIMSLVTPVLLGGFTFSVGSLALKGNRLSPKAGFKRMLGPTAAMELAKAVGKFSLVAFIAFLIIDSNFNKYMQLGRSTPHQEVVEAINYILVGLLLISCSLIIIAIIDVPFQMWNHSKQLKMTKQEIKDEYKETEGRPEVKSKIRQTQREMSHRRMMEAIPEADVVVTNPEHFSVALKYDQFSGGAPIVVAKGADEVAFNIRKVANAHHVPIMQAPPLARAIFYTTKLDQEIPGELYLAVAQVLAYVLQLNEYKKGKAARPKPIRDYPIPDSMKY
ncbi:flagellar biosynthesis protein FlhB [Pleionea mediterranea]|jgi:flagellar biosynthetic protein FlhB|uniref:Flagellar biosynthetic protein FlhB n=1 Tax=Pleionea mediterranea TaxID=523701 RepID=A0A316FLU2_9GAMM|nr:flagellar biosynthesis protein FlhB [Pleionea mediterranea]PWK49135.1 flagellar biosynthetic protein FlhB [Pleionea mediterranea]